MASAEVRVPRAREFATAQVPRGQRVALWERHNAEMLVALACRPPYGGSFAAVETNLQLGRAHLARVRGTAHLVDRSAGLVETHPTRGVAVYLTLRGEASFEHRGRRGFLRPGQLLVCDADRPLVRGFGRGLEELAVTVPWASIAGLTGMDGLDEPVVVTAGDPRGRALARIVGGAVRRDRPVPAEERMVLELVTLLAAGDRAALPVAHRVAACAYIEEHLPDRRLSATEVAGAIGISGRQLSRVFAAAGTSVPRHILARRLDTAYGLLAGGGVRVADVAARCGFGSAAYLSETFHRRFGVTAGDVRRGGQA